MGQGEEAVGSVGGEGLVAMMYEEGADAALGEDGEEEGVEDGQDAEDGEGDADVGDYVGCAGHCAGEVHVRWYRTELQRLLFQVNGLVTVRCTEIPHSGRANSRRRGSGRTLDAPLYIGDIMQRDSGPVSLSLRPCA